MWILGLKGLRRLGIRGGREGGVFWMLTDYTELATMTNLAGSVRGLTSENTRVLSCHIFYFECSFVKGQIFVIFPPLYGRKRQSRCWASDGYVHTSQHSQFVANRGFKYLAFL